MEGVYQYAVCSVASLAPAILREHARGPPLIQGLQSGWVDFDALYRVMPLPLPLASAESSFLKSSSSAVKFKPFLFSGCPVPSSSAFKLQSDAGLRMCAFRSARDVSPWCQALLPSAKAALCWTCCTVSALPMPPSTPASAFLKTRSANCYDHQHVHASLHVSLSRRLSLRSCFQSSIHLPGSSLTSSPPGINFQVYLLHPVVVLVDSLFALESTPVNQTRSKASNLSDQPSCKTVY